MQINSDTQSLQERLLRNYEKALIEGTAATSATASSSSQPVPASKSPRQGEWSPETFCGSTSAAGHAVAGASQHGVTPLFQESPLYSGNVAAQATPAHCTPTACGQASALAGGFHAPSQAAQGGNVYVTQTVPVHADTAGATAASAVPSAAAVGKDLLLDRARNLRAIPKSQGSKSKRQQFLETHGYNKPRGGKCREYFSEKYHRDP